jgi:hypothetical protein
LLHRSHLDVSIRTTLTLEDDVAQRLEAEARRTGTSLKQVVDNLNPRTVVAWPPLTDGSC